MSDYLRNYVVGSFYKFMFNLNYNTIMDLDYPDREFVFATFDFGRMALWKFENAGLEEDVGLTRKVSSLSEKLKQIDINSGIEIG